MIFAGKSAERWRDAYGSFCSSHTEAVGVFKDLMKSDRRFQQYILKCSENPLLKKKGVPECIMFVTGRIMKYPILIDALIKTWNEMGISHLQVKLQRVSSLLALPLCPKELL